MRRDEDHGEVNHYIVTVDLDGQTDDFERRICKFTRPLISWFSLLTPKSEVRPLTIRLSALP